jgi:signal transduction histidine kinase
MRRQFRVPMAVIAGALLGLIALLATLQYRWLGQISGAERERMTRTLNHRATAYGQDVDRELTRAYLTFQIDALSAEPDPRDPGISAPAGAAHVAGRHDRWQATARFPRLVKDVYLVPPQESGEPLLLQRYNPATRFLEPADWPAAAVEIQKQLSRPPSSSPPGAGPTLVMRAMTPAVWASVPALVIPAPILMVSHIDGRGPAASTMTPMRIVPDVRYTLVMLDGDYIRSEMLPALAQQHFARSGDDFDYQLAVIPAAGNQSPVYHSAADFVPAPDAKADANVELFQVRVQDFPALAAEVSRFAMFTGLHKPTATEQRTTVIVQSSTGTAAVNKRIDRVLAGGSAGTFSTRLNAAPAPGWRLLVKHPSGSLEAAVNAARRRNLIISSTILGVLGLSVGFLVVSTRRAHDLARQQLEFVATVSHELRTPLAVIRSAADNLADGVVDDETRIRQYGQLVRREGLRLTDLVEQILEFAGLQSGQREMTVGPVEIGTLLRDVIATAEATAPAGVAFDLAIADNLPSVRGDEAALRRVFQNLVGNAIKYGAEARWIGIRAAAAGQTIEVSVSDRGIGIAAADQGRIFDPFYRAPNVVAAQIQGAGLGLSLVKRIVEAHAGRITLTSAPGEGSTFTVSLPLLHGDAAGGDERIGQAAPLPS